MLLRFKSFKSRFTPVFTCAIVWLIVGLAYKMNRFVTSAGLESEPPMQVGSPAHRVFLYMLGSNML